MITRKIGNRSDTWSVGALLYRMMTGNEIQQYQRFVNAQSTYHHYTQRQFLYSGRDGATIPYHTFGRNLATASYSPLLIDLAYRCLALDQTRRPAARTLLRTVKQWIRIFNNPRASLGRLRIANQASWNTRLIDTFQKGLEQPVPGNLPLENIITYVHPDSNANDWFVAPEDRTIHLPFNNGPGQVQAEYPPGLIQRYGRPRR